MHVTQGDRTFVRSMTLREALERAAVPPRDGMSKSSRENENSWAGESWAAAMRKAEHGDPTAAVLFKKQLEVERGFRPAPRATSVWGEAGSLVDVGRFMSGEPECMVETVRAGRLSPVVKIAVERAVSYVTHADTMRATGASALAAVEMLRMSGIPAEIWVTFTQGRELTMSQQVLIQQAGRPIDIDRLAFWVVNPAALRRIGFSLEEQEDNSIRQRAGITHRGAYGAPFQKPCNEKEFDEIAPSSAQACEAWLRDVLVRRAGITIKKENE